MLSDLKVSEGQWRRSVTCHFFLSFLLFLSVWMILFIFIQATVSYHLLRWLFTDDEWILPLKKQPKKPTTTKNPTNFFIIIIEVADIFSLLRHITVRLFILIKKKSDKVKALEHILSRWTFLGCGNRCPKLYKYKYIAIH